MCDRKFSLPSEKKSEIREFFVWPQIAITLANYFSLLKWNEKNVKNVMENCFVGVTAA